MTGTQISEPASITFRLWDGLLQLPGVAVGILEIGVAGAPACADPGEAVATPVPMAIEQAEPGGVS